jgi:hypothetical protein
MAVLRGYRLQVTGCRLQVTGCRVQGAGCRVQVEFIIDTSYVVSEPEDISASGRAEESGSFSQRIHFVKKIKRVPCCRRRIKPSLRETFGLHINRVIPVIERTDKQRSK